MLDRFKDIVDRLRLVRIVTVISIIFVVVLQLLRLFHYDVLGRFQLLILPALFLFAYGMPALSQERVAIFPQDQFYIWKERLLSGLFSFLFLFVGIALMILNIIVQEAVWFYLCFFAFNFSGFYIYHLAHLGEASEEYMEIKNDIDQQKDHYDMRF